jgi:hypothetical protein
VTTYAELAEEYADKIKALSANYEYQMKRLYLQYQEKHKILIQSEGQDDTRNELNSASDTVLQNPGTGSTSIIPPI